MRRLTARGSETQGGSRLDAMRVTGDHADEARTAAPDLFDGTYDLTSLIGQGSMGEVWRARNINLDKEVAIKLVKLQSDDRLADVRLRNEARLVAKMSHPNVIAVYDAGVARDGRYYLVMELLEGQDLREVLEQRRTLPAIQAVQILVPVLAGLDCAHRRKILHRDIKPENIFVARSEDTTVPKLLDFGIALARDRPSAVRTTCKGVFIGTPLYMAPEQIQGASELDERADIWAIATVLYELIAGHVPFASDDLRVLFSSIASAVVPPIDETLCDVELAAILERGLAKDPAERWPSARELARALVTWLLARGVTEDVSGDSLEKSWLSLTLRRTRPDSERLSADALHTVLSRAPHLAVNVAIRPPFSRFLPSIGFVSFGLLGVAFLTFIERRPDRRAEVDDASAISAPSDRALPPVKIVVPAPAADSPKLENPAMPPAQQAQKSRQAPAREQPVRDLHDERPARDAPLAASALDAEADVDVPPAPAPKTPTPEARRPTVDPTWGF